MLFLLDTKEASISSYDEATFQQVLNLARDSDVIGISLMSRHHNVVKDLCIRLKEKVEIPIVLGGVHPTALYNECIKFSDFIFRGESELAFAKFVTKLESGEFAPFDKIDNLVFKRNGEVVVNDVACPVALDDLPLPDYEETHYCIRGGTLSRLTAPLFTSYSYQTYMAFPTRGCPFRCSYCCNSLYNRMCKGQKILRQMSVKNIIRELVWAKAHLKPTSICFESDAFMLVDDDYLARFAKSYADKVDLPLIIGGLNPTLAHQLNRKLGLLKPANIATIRFGIQSGSERIRKSIYSRTGTNDDILETAEVLRQNGIDYVVDIILNNPFECDADLEQTAILLSKLRGVYKVNEFSLAFFPGTELYDRAVREGIIPDNWELVTRSDHWSTRRIEPSAMNKLVLNSVFVSEKVVSGLLRLRKVNALVFKVSIAFLGMYARIVRELKRVRKAIKVYGTEGSKGIISRIRRNRRFRKGAAIPTGK